MESQSYTSSFATIYDDVMKRVPYFYWYKYLKNMLSYYEKDPKSILELACGTGNMLKHFVNEAEQIYGIDKSEEMLSIAKNKFDERENIKLFNTDMTEIHEYGDFDFIYSIFDSLNYILGYEKLVNVFKNAAYNLNKDGIFIFDMNTIYRLMDMKEGTKSIKGEDYTCYWKDIIDRDKKQWIVELDIYMNKKGEIKNFTEKHIETSYSLKNIKRALKIAGFEYIDFYRSFTFKKGDSKNDRIHFIACKKEPEVRKIKQVFLTVKWNILSPFISTF